MARGKIIESPGLLLSMTSRIAVTASDEGIAIDLSPTNSLRCSLTSSVSSALARCGTATVAPFPMSAIALAALTSA